MFKKIKNVFKNWRFADDYGLIQLILFIWQPYGLLMIWADPTLSPDLKFLGTIINISFFFYIYVQVARQQWNVLNWAIGTMLLIWYLHYTPIDFHNPGYTPLQKFVYVSIDIFSLFYLGYTLTTNTFSLFKKSVRIRLYITIDKLKAQLAGAQILFNTFDKIKSLLIGKI